MIPSQKKLSFNGAGYAFMVLFLLALAGFWPSYFTTLFSLAEEHSFYVHFHAAAATMWILLLIIQPLLIKRKNLIWHQRVGKFSYVAFPLLLVSVVLLMHTRLKTIATMEDIGVSFFIPAKDVIILILAYGMAIKFRKALDIHARAMIVTGMALIEPALVRFISFAVVPHPHAFPVTLVVIYTLFLLLIFLERKQKAGRWVFPSIAALLLVFHAVILFNLAPDFLGLIARWFVSLPITH